MWIVLAEEAPEAPEAPPLVIIMNVGVHPVLSHCGLQVGFGKGHHMEPLPTVVKITLSREKGVSRRNNPHSAMASPIPWGNQLQQGWEEVVWKV